ncbi:3-hydroxyacyl-CoA dehydrogenase [Bombardia bombarda]|uniref:3-hydroxyacyl-CoA dehydrogenase n=1 Tax=Bombardia bombarda TaxID=252184 RepID=A0AA39XMT4_9PEZI|nr:3-hydroxyacyl-CoA dehydrogenase [Bombardia bombarda]
MAIDCLPESLELKMTVLSQLERLLPDPNCILASNSSSLQTSEMAPALRHPERLLNTHYFIPPRNRMVELMSSSHTHAAIFPFLADQMRGVGLTPLVVPAGVLSQGFIFNRIWAACKRETLGVLSEGVAQPADIDALFRDFFHAEKGPCERMDEIGLDTIAKIEAHYLELRPDLRDMGIQEPLDWLRIYYLEQHRLGEKSGDGLFTKEEREELNERHRMLRHRVVEETTDA